MKKYNITGVLLRIEEEAKDLGFYSRYDEGLGSGESDELRLRSNDTIIAIRDFNNPKVVKPLYANIIYKGYRSKNHDYIGMYDEMEVVEMLKGLWKCPWKYIEENFEK